MSIPPIARTRSKTCSSNSIVITKPKVNRNPKGGPVEQAATKTRAAFSKIILSSNSAKKAELSAAS